MENACTKSLMNIVRTVECLITKRVNQRSVSEPGCTVCYVLEIH